jgi:DNA-binding IclR family transcriptional regulator
VHGGGRGRSSAQPPVDGARTAGGEPGRGYAALQGVGRAMEILEAIAERPMRASELAERLSLKWTTAHRCLTHLLENRYLRRNGLTGTYSIGPRLYYLGQAYLRNHPLLDAGAQVLRALAHETGATAQLNERESLQATVVMTVDPTLEMISKTSPEFQFPLHVGSKGQILLAFSSPLVFGALVRRPLVALTENSITRPDLLLETLIRIRTQGYAVTREDVQIGTGSVAAPVFEEEGRLAGAVCAIVKAGELSGEARTVDLVAAVAHTAREISLRLGWRYGDQPAAVAEWAGWDDETGLASSLKAADTSDGS